MAEVTDLLWLDVDEVQFDPDNPNVEGPVVFNELVEGIRTTGFIQPISVVAKDGGYVLFAGEHRWKAAKVLGLEKIPAVLVAGLSDDERQFQMVRLNVVRGGPDPVKFRSLYDKLSKKYGSEKVRQEMGLSTDRMFQKVYRDVARKMGVRPSAEVEERIETIDDLSLVLNGLFARYGGTLSQHFMVFTFGGKAHAMIRLDDAGWAVVSKWLAGLEQSGEDVNAALMKVLRSSRAKKT